MSFQIPSHRNSINRTKDRRNAWRELVRSIPKADHQSLPPIERMVLRTPRPEYFHRLDEASRKPAQISFVRAAVEINDKVSFRTWGDLSVGESIDALLESGAIIYTKKAIYQIISPAAAEQISNNEFNKIEVSRKSC